MEEYFHLFWLEIWRTFNGRWHEINLLEAYLDTVPYLSLIAVKEKGLVISRANKV
jgi:hypothetical protein